MTKRKQTFPEAANRFQTLERPPPPPPPPKALIQLIQRDKSVLNYFTLLQANLEADKAKWKYRVQAAESECAELKSKLVHQTQHDHATDRPITIPGKLREKEKGHFFEDSNKLLKASMKRDTTTAEGEAIDDKMLGDIFDNLSSDDSTESSVDLDINDSRVVRMTPSLSVQRSLDDEGSYGDGDFGGQPGQSLAKPWDRPSDDARSADIGKCDDCNGYQITSKTPMDDPLPFQNVYYHRLCEANESLNQLGISLVKIDGSRRSNPEVVQDILQALRTVSQCQIMNDDKRSSGPFTNMIPSCDREDHPAYKAKQFTLASLRIMDLYCGEYDNREWDQLTSAPDGVKQISIHVGLRSRQTLVKQFMESLSAEVSDVWPITDRSTRISSTAQHFDSSKIVALSKDNECIGLSAFGGKSLARLSTMVERCILVQLLTDYLDRWMRHSDRIHLLCRYVLSTVPSLASEDYPLYPPVLSMIVIEALIAQGCMPTSSSNLLFNVQGKERSTLEAVALAVHISMYIWQQRLQSNDNRITDVAKVEVACYKRIMKLGLDWLGESLSSHMDFKMKAFALNLRDNPVGASICAVMDRTCFERLKCATKEHTDSGWLDAILAFCIATRNVQIRRLNCYREAVGTQADVDEFTEQQRFLSHIAKSALGRINGCWKPVDVLLKCCVQLSDGARAAELAQYVMKSFKSLQPIASSHEVMKSLVMISRIPLIRFINLKRRVDRRNFFQAQAKVEKLLIVDALVDLNAEECRERYFWGCYAFDGRSETFIENNEDSVAAFWRPSDLKAFDRDALPDARLVKLSQSERACAMSHISSWEGVRRSLQMPPSSGLSTALCDHPEHVNRLFRVSGFASGKAFHEENEAMPPSAVSVIMEDDAILVDRFVDRLEVLLEELPRDFHFCSLGFSRPKNAPILPFSSELGIPTCIWYLTGYILSLEGADYLRQNLPVRGPVDCWIGLRMCSNWDNEYGLSIGVGTQPKPAPELPSWKELSQVMRFRAFCALTPLCYQKVNSSASGTRGSWRQRDTDIDYSGIAS